MTGIPLALRLVHLVLALLYIAACDRRGEGGNAEATKQEAAPVEVTVMVVEPQNLPVTFEAVGQTEGSREVEVRARVGGILLRRAYTEGNFVKQGTLLFKIDPAPYEAAVMKPRVRFVTRPTSTVTSTRVTRLTT